MEPQRQILINHTPYTLHDLYNKYAGMLLGYISEITKDHQQSEQHLVNIFNSIPQHLSELNSDAANTWCQLQRIAKSHLTGHVKFSQSHHTAQVGINNYSNKLLNEMNEDQKLIFCSVYYKGKTILQLSQELNLPEDNIRKCLKEAFTTIRKFT